MVPPTRTTKRGPSRTSPATGAVSPPSVIGSAAISSRARFEVVVVAVTWTWMKLSAGSIDTTAGAPASLPALTRTAMRGSPAVSRRTSSLRMTFPSMRLTPARATSLARSSRPPRVSVGSELPRR